MVCNSLVRSLSLSLWTTELSCEILQDVKTKVLLIFITMLFSLLVASMPHVLDIIFKVFFI